MDGLADDAQLEHGQPPIDMTPGDWFVLNGIWDGRAIVADLRREELEAKLKQSHR